MCTLVGASVEEDPEDTLEGASWEPDCCWGPCSGPREEQYIVLTAGPSLHPWNVIFSLHIYISVCLLCVSSREAEGLALLEVELRWMWAASAWFLWSEAGFVSVALSVCPRTHFVDQAGLEPINTRLLSARIKGLCHHYPDTKSALNSCEMPVSGHVPPAVPNEFTIGMWYFKPPTSSFCFVV